MPEAEQGGFYKCPSKSFRLVNVIENNLPSFIIDHEKTDLAYIGKDVF